MTNHLSIQIKLLILLTGFSLACNKVKENPEPDTFSTSEMRRLDILAEGGKADIDVLAANSITSSVTVTFKDPAHGEIGYMPSIGKFQYVADPGFEGTDSVAYDICKTGGVCKGSMVKIKVTNNPCHTVFAQTLSDTCKYEFVAGGINYKMPLFPGDFYCQNDGIVVTHKPLSTQATVQISNDSLNLRINRAIRGPVTYTIGYRVTDSSQNPVVQKVRFVKVRFTVSENYCDQIFKVADRMDWNSNNAPHVTFSPSTLEGTITSCSGDVDLSFFKMYGTPNLLIEETNPLTFKVSTNPSNPAGAKYVYYIYRNLRMVADTGRMKIDF